MFKLANNMSFVVSYVTHGFDPRRYVQIGIVLVPTPGAPSPDPETIDKYGAVYSLYYDVAHDETKATTRALVGETIQTIRQWIKGEFDKYQKSEKYETQLAAIFEYVTSVGLAA